MSSNSPTLEQVLAEAEQLPPDDRLRLISHVVATLILGESPGAPRQLVYGEFAGPGMSKEDDFLAAEWRPSDWEQHGT